MRKKEGSGIANFGANLKFFADYFVNKCYIEL